VKRPPRLPPVRAQVLGAHPGDRHLASAGPAVSLNVAKGGFLNRPRKLAHGLLAFELGAARPKDVRCWQATP
jgi:hypothetical protein